MMVYQEKFNCSTHGRGLYDVTQPVVNIVNSGSINIGLCHIFIHHTSASLILCENADATVQTDLETFMSTLVPDGNPMFKHRAEGPDDMAAHVRTVLTQSSLSIPITSATLGLGMWQGIYVWEHRTQAYSRQLTITIQGA